MPAYTNNSNSSFASKSLPPALYRLCTGRRPVMERISASQGLSHQRVINKSTCRLQHSTWDLLYPQRLVPKWRDLIRRLLSSSVTGLFRRLAGIIKHQLATIIIILDNGVYGTERLIHDGMFNDINTWQYQMLPQVLGGGKGHEVCNEGEFDKALSESLSNDTEVRLMRVHITVKITAPPLIASVQV